MRRAVIPRMRKRSRIIRVNGPHQPGGSVGRPQMQGDVEEGQDAGIPQPAVGQQPEEHQGDERDPGQRKELPLLARHGVGHADEAERGRRQQLDGQQVADGVQLVPGHVRRPLQVGREGQRPEGGEREAHGRHSRQVEERPPARVAPADSPGTMHTSTMVVTMCESTRAIRIRQLSTKSMLNCGFSMPRYMVPRNRNTRAKLSM